MNILGYLGLAAHRAATGGGSAIRHAEEDRARPSDGGQADACSCSTNRRRGLTHGEVDDLGQTIRGLRDQFGLTVLLVEHHMQLVMGISDKVVVLDFGRKIAEGPPSDDPERSECHRGLSRKQCYVSVN